MTAHTKTFGQYVKDLSEEELIEKYHNTSNDEVLFEWVVKELRFRGWRVDKHFKDRGIKARNTHSPYYGHIAIEVELTQAKVAGSIIDELKGN